jgi:hypothetical protein
MVIVWITNEYMCMLTGYEDESNPSSPFGLPRLIIWRSASLSAIQPVSYCLILPTEPAQTACFDHRHEHCHYFPHRLHRSQDCPLQGHCCPDPYTYSGSWGQWARLAEVVMELVGHLLFISTVSGEQTRHTTASCWKGTPATSERCITPEGTRTTGSPPSSWRPSMILAREAASRILHEVISTRCNST